MINISNKDFCLYYKSVVNISLINFFVYWNYKYIRRFGTLDWIKINRINI